MTAAERFASDLHDLCYRHNVQLDGCGCHGSPYTGGALDLEEVRVNAAGVTWREQGVDHEWRPASTADEPPPSTKPEAT